MTTTSFLPRSAAAPPLDDDDLLSEILLRLPPQPSSLPRASLVCRRWRSLLSDPAFRRRFRIHHRRSPPLLGFIDANQGITFQPALDAPDRLPRGHFSLNLDDRYMTLGWRHGLALFFLPIPLQVVVWDPVAGVQHRLAVPPGFGFHPLENPINGTVLPAAGDIDHFQVVLVLTSRNRHVSVIRVEGGEMGLLVVSGFIAQLWKRETDSHGDVSWSIGRTIELDKLLPRNSEKEPPNMIGYAEENNVAFFWTVGGVFMVHLESLQLKKLPVTGIAYRYYPFEIVYTPGIGGGHEGVEVVRHLWWTRWRRYIRQLFS
uniref:F-box domain-containing protein n=1 Tax=Aegilops tauschii subsp. strangulata TaxID=200361 RepID=A0A453N278_AEGTS